MLASLKPLFLIAAVQAGGAGAGAAEPDAAAPSHAAGPGTTGAVEVGPIAEVLDAHEVDVTLRGSPESMARQHAVAVASDLSFMGTLEEMETLAGAGDLVPIDGGPHYEVMDWVFPYGIPEVRAFVERLALEYRRACGEALVVTSLTRPYSEQLPNSHQLSVHPAGMAVDLRIPRSPDCRAFLETRLLAREDSGLVDITRERAPPHYHVALFPGPYAEWEAAQPDLPGITAADDAGARRQEAPPPGASGTGWGVVVVCLGIVAALGAGWWHLRGRRG